MRLYMRVHEATVDWEKKWPQQRFPSSSPSLSPLLMTYYRRRLLFIVSRLIFTHMQILGGHDEAD